MKAFGAKDQGMQEYLADHERFADLINGTVFAGKQIIEAQYLKEVQRKKRVSVADTADLVNLQKKNSSSQMERREFIWKGSVIFYGFMISLAVDS